MPRPDTNAQTRRQAVRMPDPVPVDGGHHRIALRRPKGRHRGSRHLRSIHLGMVSSGSDAASSAPIQLHRIALAYTGGERGVDPGRERPIGRFLRARHCSGEPSSEDLRFTPRTGATSPARRCTGSITQKRRSRTQPQGIARSDITEHKRAKIPPGLPATSLAAGEGNGLDLSQGRTRSSTQAAARQTWVGASAKLSVSSRYSGPLRLSRMVLPVPRGVSDPRRSETAPSIRSPTKSFGERTARAFPWNT